MVQQVPALTPRRFQGKQPPRLAAVLLSYVLCTKSQDTTGFSRVEVQFGTNLQFVLDCEDTTDFSRVELQLLAILRRN